MISKVLIISIVFLSGCAEKNISKEIDEKTRASMRKTYELGNSTSSFGGKIGSDVRGTLEQSIMK